MLNTMKQTETHLIVFGDAKAPRCQARSKRSGEQCRKAAMSGKRVCRTHGGASTGPKTDAGRQRCADAKTIHGRETREIRRRHSDCIQKLRLLEWLMIDLDMIPKRPRPHRR